MSSPHWPVELKLLLEEICSDLSRLHHAAAHNLSPSDIRVDREASLGRPGTFADIRVRHHAGPATFVEVKFGYSGESVVRALERKYRTPTEETKAANRVILVIEEKVHATWAELLPRLHGALHSGLTLEVWNEDTLQRLLKTYGVEVERLTPATLLEARAAIEHAKGVYAFNAGHAEGYRHDALRAQLLWHLDFWRLRELYAKAGHPREILTPGSHRGVVVIMADMCAFSSFVRDTPDNEIVRESLTSFYSKARAQIVHNGGLHYQFVGDEVVGIFGVPDRHTGYIDAAYEAARAICSIGKSVAGQWQRRIDRLQTGCGVHVGMSIGELDLIPLRPYSRTHIGFVGDSLNVAARLMSQALGDEIVVTNSLYQKLDEKWQTEFSQTDPVDAKNVGRIVAWRSKVPL